MGWILLIFGIPIFLVALSFFSWLIDISEHSFTIILFDRVKECISTNSVREHIYRELDKAAPEYWLRGKEQLTFADAIFLAFREDMITTYFYGKLKTTKKITRLTPEDYFFYCFLLFLHQHNTDIYFCNKKMYELISQTNYGGYGAYDATYSLTDYGLAYQKVYYVTALYCENNKYIKELLNHNVSGGIKKCIDKQEIEISAM